MLKRLPILAIAALVTVLALAAQPDKAAAHNQQPANQQPMATISAAPNQDCAAAHQAKADPDPPKFYTAIKRPEWWLVGAAFLTLYAIWRQVKESAAATKAMRESIRIQEAGMQQWIDVETRGMETSAKWVRPVSFRLQFEAINNTPWLLTIQKIETTVSLWAEKWETFTVSHCVPLPPSRDGKSSGYGFYVESDEVNKVLSERGDTLPTINGEITFKDCLGNICVQPFGGFYSCGPAHFEYMKPIGVVPDKETAEKQNPN